MLKNRLGKLNSIFGENLSHHIKDSRRKLDKEKEVTTKLDSWKNGLEHYSLVHTISAQGGVSKANRVLESPLFISSTEECFSKWDVISSSLVRYSRNSFSAFEEKGMGARALQIELAVPVQNILGTHTRDVSFPNHAGRENNSPIGKILNPYELSDSIKSGRKKNGTYGRPFNELIEFNKFTKTLSFERYNEVLLVGRPGVRLYDGYPPTERIKVECIRYFPIYLLRNNLNDKQIQAAVESDAHAITKLVKLNNKTHFSFELAHLNVHLRKVRLISACLFSIFHVAFDSKVSHYRKEILVR